MYIYVYMYIYIYIYKYILLPPRWGHQLELEATQRATDKHMMPKNDTNRIFQRTSFEKEIPSWGLQLELEGTHAKKTYEGPGISHSKHHTCNVCVWDFSHQTMIFTNIFWVWVWVSVTPLSTLRPSAARAYRRSRPFLGEPASSHLAKGYRKLAKGTLTLRIIP